MKSGVKKFWSTIIPQGIWKKLFRASIQLVPPAYLAKNNFNSMWWSLQQLSDLGFKPNTVIDVGAYKGLWTTEVKNIFKDSKFLMVEAQPDKKDILEKLVNSDPRLNYEPSLAGNKDGEEQIFTVMKTGSSVYTQIYEGNAERSEITLKSKTLDTMINEHGLKGEFFLKLDVQGYEIEVLKGAENILKNTPAIILEASLLNYNSGAPLIDEIMAFLKDKNYLLFDICEFNRKSEDGVLNQVDLIFCKADWEIRDKVNFK